MYLALGIVTDGTKDALGIWIEQNEGAKFWLVMNELRNGGVEDILIAVVDGLKGFPEAITAVFPLTSVQTCVVHLSCYCLSSAAGRSARCWRANSKPFTELKPRRWPSSGSLRVRSEPSGQKVSDDRRELAPQLGTNRPLLRLRPGGAKDHLHHQCD